MTADEYLRAILQREAVNTTLLSPVRNVQAEIEPIIKQWAGDKLISVSPSGSFAKGTANKSDFFISLSPRTTETLKEIYNKLSNWFAEKNYAPKKQNVSINIRASGYSVDLVPAKRQDFHSEDHSVYRRKADSWTKTNVATHIKTVLAGGRIAESRVLKLWRNQKSLDFPSFYLELTVIEALAGRYSGTTAGNVLNVFEYLRDRFTSARVVDPANTNNIISDDLTAAEKNNIRLASQYALGATNWRQIVV